MCAAQLGHSFNIDSIEVVSVPIAKTTWNQFDEHGLILSLSRAKSETNSHYKRRLKETLFLRANSSYNGLVYGITRELGLETYNAITINPKLRADGSGFIAVDPTIVFDGSYLYLYTDYSNDYAELVIDRYELGGNYETLSRLIDKVNQTVCFHAALEDGASNSKSMTILNQSNRVFVRSDPCRASTKFQLKNKFICSGTLFFSDRVHFKTEKTSESVVTSYGDYYVDYKEAIVTSYSVPPIEATARYEYITYPFKAIASPVILHDITNSNFKTKLFNQELQDDTTYVDSTPTGLGTEVIDNLLSVKPIYWGK